jgi:hypothetical protein
MASTSEYPSSSTRCPKAPAVANRGPDPWVVGRIGSRLGLRRGLLLAAPSLTLFAHLNREPDEIPRAGDSELPLHCSARVRHRLVGVAAYTRDFRQSFSVTEQSEDIGLTDCEALQRVSADCRMRTIWAAISCSR